MTNFRQCIKPCKIVIAVLLISLILILPMTSKQGINYQVRSVKMPLYIKVIEFIDRDYQYKELSKRIIKGCNTNEEKALAIFKWTRQNIRTNWPRDSPVVDDHIWNIIIRGYGADDQSADVFNTLCVYSGIPAMRVKFFPKDKSKHINVSIVNINGKLSIFDTYRGHYFINEKGEIASLEDIINNPNLIRQQAEGEIYREIEYARFFEDLNSIKEIKTIRGRYQMPIPRILGEVKGIFKR